MKVAIYARTSRQEGDREGSVPDQIRDCREYAAEQDWEVVAEYADPGISGWKRKTRQQYEQLFADAEAGLIDAVLCRDDERLLRSDLEGQRWLDLYDRTGFRHFRYVDMADVDLRRAADRKTWKERVAAAVYYSERLGEKQRSAKRTAKEQGAYTGGEREPFGYQRVDGKLEIDPDEAALLRDAVRRLGSGQSATRICKDWNIEGRKTSRGARWRPQTLRRTLSSDHMTGGRGYPRVLTDEEAAIARAALAGEERRQGRQPGKRATLSGYVFCADCGQKMTTGSGYYRCSTSHGGCGHTSIRQWPLDQYVAGEIAKRWRPKPRPKQNPSAEKQKMLDELHHLEEREKEISEALASGDMSARVAGDASRKIEGRRKDLVERLAGEIPPKTPPPIKDRKQIFEAAITGAVTFLRDVLAASTKRVVVSRRQRRGRDFEPERVEIEWKA